MGKLTSRKFWFTVFGILILTGFGIGFIIQKNFDPSIWIALMAHLVMFHGIYCKFNVQQKNAEKGGFENASNRKSGDNK